MKKSFALAAVAASLAATPAAAAPGVGGKVYGARIEKGVTEVELRYGRLSGDAADGEDAAVLELSHAFTDNFLAGVLVETEREPHQSRKVEAYSIETIGHIGRIDSLGLDVALYGEYEAVRHGADEIEAKLLLQHTKGPFDARLNLKFGKELEKGAPVELGYAASADWAAFGEFRLGAEAFGNLVRHGASQRHAVSRIANEKTCRLSRRKFQCAADDGHGLAAFHGLKAVSARTKAGITAADRLFDKRNQLLNLGHWPSPWR